MNKNEKPTKQEKNVVNEKRRRKSRVKVVPVDEVPKGREYWRERLRCMINDRGNSMAGFASLIGYNSGNALGQKLTIKKTRQMDDTELILRSAEELGVSFNEILYGYEPKLIDDLVAALHQIPEWKRLMLLALVKSEKSETQHGVPMVMSVAEWQLIVGLCAC